MRWDELRIHPDTPPAPGPPGAGGGPQAGGGPGTTGRPGGQPGTAAPALFERGAITRSFDTPGFRGMTFFEVHARSVINRVPDSSRVPFRWTINPYRGCSHSCVYCFARNTHTYLDLDAGHDFDSKIVVKVNAPARVRKELSSPRWQGEHIAMGTNVDVYQRAEGKYRLMPGILQALLDARNPYSILTKGTLILRDLDLLLASAEVTDVGLSVSVGLHGRGPVADCRAGHAQPPAAAGRVPHAQRERAALRRADGPGRAVPVRLPRPAGVHRAADRRGGRHPRQPDRAAPAARGPGVVPGLAGRAPSRPGPALPGTVRPRGLRAQGLPAADRRAGQRAGGALPGRARQPAAEPAHLAPRGRGRPPPPSPRQNSSPCSDQPAARSRLPGRAPGAARTRRGDSDVDVKAR